MSSIKNVIAVVSGKGGVGKSLVTSLMASSMQKKGYHTAIMDADITGPSIPKAFGMHEKAYANEMGLIPVKTRGGIDIMSINLLLDNDTDPVLWRGPVIAGAVSQFWSEVIWDNVDYMFVDMPPGNRGRSFDGFPVPSPEGNHCGNFSPGAGIRYCGKSGKNGGDDEYTCSWHRGKYVVLRMSRLPQQTQHLRGKPYRTKSPPDTIFPQLQSFL